MPQLASTPNANPTPSAPVGSLEPTESPNGSTRRAEATSPALARLVGLELLPERACSTLDAVQASAEDQEGAVEEIASLMSNINTSIASINERVDTLSTSAEEASASILEMGARSMRSRRPRHF